MPQNYDSSVASMLSANRYQNREMARVDILTALRNYRGLIPKVEAFVFNDGSQRKLICLSGTIPVPFENSMYNIPICIWLLDTHPIHGPMCYVKPTSDMMIRENRHVDRLGKIYLPYLNAWDQNTSDLVGLIQMCIMSFSEKPPVYSRIGTRPQINTPVNTQEVYQLSTPLPYPAAYVESSPITSPSVALPYPTDGYTQPGNTITQAHIKASLLSAVEDKIRRLLRDQFAEKSAEMDSLQRTHADLLAGKSQLESIIEKLRREESSLNSDVERLKDIEKMLKESLEGHKNNKDIEPDEAIVTQGPLFRQLLDAFAEEAAIEDAIYFLGEGLRRGVIECEAFLKHVRQLSRRQFMLRATMIRCRMQAKLPI